MSLVSAIRRVLVSFRDGLDRWLHPRRRARAARRLRELRPRSVLFLCLGNVCRSPYAEAVFNQTHGSRLVARSAGFIGPGRPPPEHALAAARATGVEHGEHRSKTVTPALLADADVIFVFDRFHIQRLRRIPGAPLDRVLWLGDFEPEWAGRRAILDPWGKPPEDFVFAFARIRRCVDEVSGAL